MLPPLFEPSSEIYGVYVLLIFKRLVGVDCGKSGYSFTYAKMPSLEESILVRSHE